MEQKLTGSPLFASRRVWWCSKGRSDPNFVNNARTIFIIYSVQPFFFSFVSHVSPEVTSPVVCFWEKKLASRRLAGVHLPLLGPSLWP